MAGGQRPHEIHEPRVRLSRYRRCRVRPHALYRQARAGRRLGAAAFLPCAGRRTRCPHDCQAYTPAAPGATGALTMEGERSQGKAERVRDVYSGSDKQPSMLDVENPWPGLAAYDEASSEFFHGRYREAQELLRLIRLA